MGVDRRKVLGLIGLGGAAGAAEAAHAGPRTPGAVRFEHGVAAGDPLTDRLVLWTRVTPENPQAAVRWRVAVFDAESGRRAAARSGVTDAGRDHTVKVDVTGLKPGRVYRYRFEAHGAVSPEGLARTLPPADSEAEVTLVACSCSLHPAGLFNAYDAMARLERLDAVVHLGDYIYEYGAEPDAYGMDAGLKLGRLPEPPTETVTLADYRRRHAQYKRDPDLQAAHARAAWICVYDDHEITNDPWVGGAENHQPETEGDWEARKAAALKAWFEWMPVREPAPGQGLAEAVRRSFRFGRTASLHMMETRLLARDEQLDYERDLTWTQGPDGRPAPDVAAFEAKRADPARSLLGAAQLAAIAEDARAAAAAGTTWQVLGSQVVMARVKGPDVAAAMGPQMLDMALSSAPPRTAERLAQAAALFATGVPINLDAWDGYPAERERLYAALKAAGARPLVISGDSHTFWANDLYDAAGRRVGAEFGATGITSPPPSLAKAIPGVRIDRVIAAQNPEVAYCDMTRRGFVVLTLTRERATAELVGVSTILERPYRTETLKRYAVRAEPDGGVGALTEA